MNHIFGNTDDITFGTSSSSHTSQKKQRTGTAMKQAFHREDSGKGYGKSSQQATRAARTVESVQSKSSELDPLMHLVSTMKPSFLPKEEDMNSVRVVIFSDSNEKDPLMLFARDGETILIGSGFGETIRAGKRYATFPDMRLLVSEKEHISAWILPDNSIEIAPLLAILPTLGFPPIYASREMIAQLRESIRDATFLEKCRFFELFPSGSRERRIGTFECIVGYNESSPIILFQTAGVQIGREIPTHFGIPGMQVSQNVCLLKKEKGYLIGDIQVTAGEILSFKDKKSFKHPLKFTFDTFYIDGNSIGVIAGYTLSDREQLSENGILTFTIEEDSRVRTIAGHIFIDSRGFVHSYEMMSVHKEILKGIRVTYEKLVVENPKIERGELVQSLRREITKYCYVLTGRTPVVMPIVIDR